MTYPGKKMNTRALASVTALAVGLTVGVYLLHGAARSGQPPPAPDEIRTVDVRSDCDHPVWIAYGRTPPYQTENALSLGAGSTSTQSMLEGDKVWLLDDELRAIESSTVGAGTAEIVVASSCDSLTTTPTQQKTSDL